MSYLRGVAAIAAVYGLLGVLVKILGVCFVFYIARSVSTENFARFSLLYAIQSGVASIVMSGVYEGMVKRWSGEASEQGVRGAIAASNIIVVIGGLLLSCIAVMISSDGYLAVISAGFSGLAVGFSLHQAQLLRLLDRHWQSLWFAAFVSLFAIIGGAAMFLVLGTIDGVYLGFFAASFISLVVLGSFRFGCLWFRANSSDVREIVGGMIPFVLMQVVAWFHGFGGTYIVGVFSVSSDIACYAFALSSTASVQIVASSLNQVWSPRLFTLMKTGRIAEVGSMERRLFIGLGIVTGVASVGFILLYGVVLKYIGGNLLGYIDMDDGVVLMLLAYVWSLPWWQCANYFVFHGDGAKLLRVSVYSGVAGLCFSLLMLVVFGSVGIYAGFLMQAVIKSFIIGRVAGRCYAVRPVWIAVLIGSTIVLSGYFVKSLGLGWIS